VASLGTDLVLGSGRNPARVPAVVAARRQAFRAAGRVLLTPKARVRIPWYPELAGYFQRHFDLVRQGPSHNLYARDRAAGPVPPRGRVSTPGNHPDAAPCSPGFVTVAW
jgi:hypothetical protein